MIPKHKCTSYCDPEEGIHCILGAACLLGMTLARWPWPFEILSVREESDVTVEMAHTAQFGKCYGNPRCTVGYLVLIREKGVKKEK